MFDMDEDFPHDEGMAELDDDLLFSLMAGQASVAFRPRVPAHSCDCGKKIDELISAVRDLSAQVRELKCED